VLFQVMKYAGVAYLMWLAWQILRDSDRLSLDGQGSDGSARRIIVRGILINILNPKLSIFFLAFLPQFVAVDDPMPAASMFGLAVVFMVMTFVVFAGYGLFASAARRHVIDRPVVMMWLRGTLAGTLALLGLRLALADR
jgi:threonine/homoserine/homoserine lactone efflux protein